MAEDFCMRYFIKTSRAFHRQWQGTLPPYLHISFDASRVCNRELLVSLVSNSAGYLAVLPVQVLSDLTPSVATDLQKASEMRRLAPASFEDVLKGVRAPVAAAKTVGTRGTNAPSALLLTTLEHTLTVNFGVSLQFAKGEEHLRPIRPNECRKQIEGEQLHYLINEENGWSLGVPS